MPGTRAYFTRLCYFGRPLRKNLTNRSRAPLGLCTTVTQFHEMEMDELINESRNSIVIVSECVSIVNCRLNIIVLLYKIVVRTGSSIINSAV